MTSKLIPGSYVRLHMALADYRLISEHLASVTSMTIQRPGKYESKFGRFSCRRISPSLFFGVECRLLTDDEHAHVAMPEKGLLALIHFRSQGDSNAHIRLLRRQVRDILDIERLHHLVKRAGKPKVKRAARLIEAIVRLEEEACEM